MESYYSWGQLSFLIRAGADCLPTPLNLRRWKIKSSSKCILCESPQPTTSHILNGCQTALTQGRFTWRHDSVLNKLVNMIQPLIPSSCQIYADIPSWRASDSPPATLPNNISTSTLRPDLVLILNNNITILELTIPSNNKEALQAASDRKSNKLPYLHLISDLESCNYKVTYTTLEIGSLGHWTKQAIKSLSLIPNVNKKTASSILLHLSKISISCSYHIFNCHQLTSWDQNKPFYSM